PGRAHARRGIRNAAASAARLAALLRPLDKGDREGFVRVCSVPRRRKSPLGPLVQRGGTEPPPAPAPKIPCRSPPRSATPPSRLGRGGRRAPPAPPAPWAARPTSPPGASACTRPLRPAGCRHRSALAPLLRQRTDYPRCVRESSPPSRQH